MGYSIRQTAAQFRIAAAQTRAALAAVLALHSPDDITLASGGVIPCGPDAAPAQRWFAFTCPRLLKRAAERRDLAFALHAFRFRPERSRQGDIVKVAFEGERAGDEPALMEALAPFIDAGSFIEMDGEDGARWRWTFDGTTCRLDVLVPSTNGPGWLREAAPPATPTDSAPWEADPDAWRACAR